MRTVLLTLVIFAHALPAYAQYSGGTGEAEDPYRIATAADLIALGQTPDDYDKHFILTADIDLDPNLPGGKVFDRAVIAPDINDVQPGYQGKSFTGILDGNGHTISNLMIQGESYLGLFGQLAHFPWLDGGEVRNLRVVDANIVGSGQFVGGLVGYCADASVGNCHCTGSVAGLDCVGGLVGASDTVFTGGNVTRSRNGSSVTGDGSVGGLVGWLSIGSVTYSHNSGSVSGGCVGGLVGQNHRGSIATSYNSGPVSGDGRVGGLVGSLAGEITVSYNHGAVIGGWPAGGLVGEASFSSEITSSFWDTQTSGQNGSTGSGFHAGGTGLTTAEMQTASTFLDAGWDFVGETANGPNDVWKIVEGYTYPLLSWQKYGGGTGEPNDPYLIYTAEHLNALGAEPNDYDKHFKLMADIDLSGYSYDRAVIAPDMNDATQEFVGTPFTGFFSGNGHTISHVTITGENYLGLFGQLSGKVEDLGVLDVNIAGVWSYVGALSGYGGDIAASYSTGTVSGYSCVGGLTGITFASITKSYSECTVHGDNGVGGLVGESGSITMSYSTGAVTGDNSVGGLVGCNTGVSTANYCTGAVTGVTAVGGLAGCNGGVIADSYSWGAVSGQWTVGGLVGGNSFWGEGTVSNCYSTGTVTGDSSVGGSVGYNGQGIIFASFWDIEASGQTDSGGGTGLTTTEMQTASTFLEAGWDFVDETENGTDDIWRIDEGQDYPRLWWEPQALVRLPVIELDAAGFDDAIAEGVILVDFYATWCPHCAAQAPILEEVADQLQGRAQVGKLDVDKFRSIAQRYGVSAIPTLIVFQEAVEVTRFVGVTRADVLVAAILAAVDSLE